MTRLKISKRSRAVVGAVLALALVSGCGSSSSKSTSTTTAAGPASPGSAGQAAAGGGGASLAAVKAKVAAFEKGPTLYQGPTVPVKVPTGIKLATVSCAAVVRGCVRPVQEAGIIAKELGWSVTAYDGQGTPKGANDAVEQAVAGGANVILTGGVDPSFIAGGFKAANAAHVLIASMSQGVGPSPGGYAFDIGADYTLLGDMIGDYVIADSDAKAVMLPFDDKSFASALAFVAGAVDTVRACNTCSVLPRQYFVSTDISTTLGPRAVDLVRSNPKITYIDGDYDPAAAGIVPALANAGLKGKVKVVGGLANSQNLQYVKSGFVQTADAGFDNQYMGYMAIYQVARLLDKMPLWTTPGESRPQYIYSGHVPVRLFTTQSPPASTADYVATDTLNYVPKMRALLGLK